MSNLIVFFVKNQVASVLVTLMLICAGLFAGLFYIKLEASPDLSLDKIQISVEYSGASPGEVDQSIVLPIVEKLSEVTGIREYTALSYFGNANIIVDVEKGFDKKKLRNDISSQINKIKIFPGNAEKAIIQEVDILIPVARIAVYGDCQKSALKFWSDKIRKALLKFSKISRIGSEGSFEPRFCIEISEESLKNYNLSIPEIYSAISSNHMNNAIGVMN